MNTKQENHLSETIRRIAIICTIGYLTYVFPRVAAGITLSVRNTIQLMGDPQYKTMGEAKRSLDTEKKRLHLEGVVINIKFREGSVHI